jgi:hypothetical protein
MDGSSGGEQQRRADHKAADDGGDRAAEGGCFQIVHVKFLSGRLFKVSAAPTRGVSEAACERLSRTRANFKKARISLLSLR